MVILNRLVANATSGRALPGGQGADTGDGASVAACPPD